METIIKWNGRTWQVREEDGKVILTSPEILTTIKNGASYLYNQIKLTPLEFDILLTLNELSDQAKEITGEIQ